MSFIFFFALSCDSKTEPVTLTPSHDQLGGTGGYNPADAQNFNGNQTGTDPYFECGFTAQSNVSPLLNFRLTSPVLKKKGQSAQGTLSSSGQSALTIAVQFNAIGGIFDNKVQNELNQKVNSTGQVTVAPASSWEKMYLQKDAKLSQRCGIVGASQILAQTFPNAPFPYMISPTLSRARMMSELGADGKSFSMTIGGVSGTSRFTLSPENVNLSGNAIAADYAVRVQHTYGNAQTAKSLGLAQSTIYYVKAGRFVAISEETGDGDFPVVSFF